MGISPHFWNAILNIITINKENNNKMKITKYTILTLALASFAFADVKIGYVDSNEIMNNFDEVRQVQADLEKEQRRLESEFNELVFGLDSLKQDYDRQRLLMSDTRRNEKENEIANKEKSVQKFQFTVFKMNCSNLYWQKLMLPFKK